MATGRQLFRRVGGAPARALVTGASAGIGAAFAARLAREGVDLILVARSRDRLEALANELRDSCQVSVDVLAADLTRAADLRAVAEIVAGDSHLDMLVNSAGFATLGRFDQLDLEREEAEIHLNVVAPVRLTRAALPGMISRGHGYIINVSSIAAFLPGRYSATYCATKAYLNSFTEALHEELRRSGVVVQVLCPGFTRTEFHRRAGVDSSKFPSFAWMSAADVAEASLAALRRGKLVCIPGTANRLVAATLRLLPRRLVRRAGGVGAKRGWAARRRHLTSNSTDG